MITCEAIRAPIHKRPPIHFASLSSTQCSRLFSVSADVSVWLSTGSGHFIDEKAGELHPRAHPSTNAPMVADVLKINVNFVYMER
jgi:hypothetical protein